MHKKTQEDNYFEYRNITPSFYANCKLPLWIKKEILNRDSKILDFGCGFGQIISSLIDNGYKEVYGVDINDSAISYCISKGFNVKKINADYLNNPFGFKFDFIVILHVLEHMPKDRIIETLVSIKRLLLKGG